MLKKLINKRIEQFKTDFPDFKISKSGNLIVERNKKVVDKTIFYWGNSVTKNTLNKIGSSTTFKKHECDTVFLLTQKGKMMVKTKSSPRFKNTSIKDVCHFPELKNSFFIGRKYEYLKDYPNIYNYRYFQNFHSLSEAKKHLGFAFISDSDFYAIFQVNFFDYLTPMIISENKSDCYNLLKNIDSRTRDLLLDYIRLCFDIKLKPQIPAGKNKLEELHSQAVIEANKLQADKYSKKVLYYSENNFETEWVKRGLNFERLNSPYEMYVKGLSQKHCIGTNYAKSLDRYSFYSFLHKEASYEIQIHPSGSIGQFYGRKNCPVPTELKDAVIKEIDFKHSIKSFPNADFSSYPLTEPVNLYDDLDF